MIEAITIFGTMFFLYVSGMAFSYAFMKAEADVLHAHIANIYKRLEEAR